MYIINLISRMLEAVSVLSAEVINSQLCTNTVAVTVTVNTLYRCTNCVYVHGVSVRAMKQSSVCVISVL